MEEQKMISCEHCARKFKSKAKLKSHNARKLPCKPPAYFCVFCKKGLANYHTLWDHKRLCVQKPDTSLDEDQRVRKMKKRVNKFFSTLTEDFSQVLDRLEDIFPDETVTIMEDEVPEQAEQYN